MAIKKGRGVKRMRGPERGGGEGEGRVTGGGTTLWTG